MAQKKSTGMGIRNKYIVTFAAGATWTPPGHVEPVNLDGKFVERVGNDADTVLHNAYAEFGIWIVSRVYTDTARNREAMRIRHFTQIDL